MEANLKVLIIGAVAAGPKVAARVRRLMPDAQITMLDKGRHISYAGCGMPFYLDDQVSAFEDLFETAYWVPRDPDYFARERGVKVYTGMEAVAIDRQAKEVRAVNVETGAGQVFAYDKLVLATGAHTVIPPIPGMDLEGVFTLKDPGDARRIKQHLPEVQEAVVVGAGSIGMEVAGALARLRILTAVVEFQDQLLPGLLDRDMALLFKNRLETEGIDFFVSERVLRFEGENRRVATVVTDRRTLDADMVLVAVGVRPNITLAREAGLEIGATGAIAVDDRGRTSDPDIYAAGDCCESMHMVTGQPMYLPLATMANRLARVVADNIAGRDSRFRGTLGSGILQVYTWNAGKTGLGEKQARELGYDVVTTVSPQHDRAHYAPGHSLVILKLIADRATRRVLGVQGIGPGEVAKRLDVGAAVIHFEGTIDDLVDLDLSYAPPFNMTVDPLQHAANATRNKLDGMIEVISAGELREKMARGDDFCLLDVRTEKEYNSRKINDPRVKWVIMADLREAADTLPRDKEIICLCDLGIRAYEAYRFLKGQGFTNLKSVEGGLRAWPFIEAGML